MTRSLFFIVSCTLLFQGQSYAEMMQKIYKIAPYGNSITQGANTRPTYRYPLWKKLIDANIQFDFVGSINTNFGGEPSRPDYKGKAFDKDHEGHWGWRADEILNSMGGWLTKYTPDMVLYHIGTNDCIQNQSTSSTQTELTQIVGKLRDDNPEVVIFMATLVPCNASTQASANIKDLNGKIKTLASQLNTDKSPVILVDQYTGIDPSKDLYDGIHPGATGEEKMAQNWFDAIEQYMVKTQTKREVALFSSPWSKKEPSYQIRLICQRNTVSMSGESTINLLGKTVFQIETRPNRIHGVYIISEQGRK